MGIFNFFKGVFKEIKDNQIERNLKGGIDNQVNITNEDGENEIYRKTDNGKLVVDRFEKVNGKNQGSFYTYDMESGKKLLSLYYENGVIEGPYQFFLIPGVLHQEGFMKKNLKDGVCIEYYPNGQINSIGDFKNDKKNGPLKAYYENGQLEQKGKLKDDKQEGLWKYYHENGFFKSEENFKNGKREGLHKTYFENGQLAEEQNYKDGKKNGFFKSYFENGQLETQGNHRKDKQVGRWKFYFKNGKIEGENLFSDEGVLIDSSEKEIKDNHIEINLKDGSDNQDVDKLLEKYGKRLKHFFEDDVKFIHIDILGKVLKKLISNGNIDKTNRFNNNRKNGKWLCYDHENGKLLNEVNFTNDIMNGISKVYYENGALSKKGNIKDGKMDGLWEFYEKDGVKKVSFKEGFIIDGELP